MYKHKNNFALICILLAAAWILVSCMSATNIRPLDANLLTPRPITIMSYNIRIGAGYTQFGRSPYRLKDEITLDLAPVAAAISSVDPDIVGLQEVLGESQAAELGQALNMNYAYVPHGLDKYGAWWGVAILSKFPIQDITRHEISYGRGNTKAIILADIPVFGHKLVCISIHKDRDLKDGSSFEKTMQRINTINAPVVLIGDLNMWPSDDRHSYLSGRLQDSAVLAQTPSAKFARERGTYPGEDHNSWGKRIDYVLLDKDRFEVLDAGLIAKQHWDASDHLGYYTIVKIK